MTPPRLNELECPGCGSLQWEIDSDYRGTDGESEPYEERTYSCTKCGTNGVGWMLRQQSPPEFLLQPHVMYPMTQEAFDYWVDVLRTYFPDHPRLADLGVNFRPHLPGWSPP